jgi:hypothetical protein
MLAGLFKVVFYEFDTLLMSLIIKTIFLIMIPASVFHSIVPCVAITLSEEYMATVKIHH